MDSEFTKNTDFVFTNKRFRFTYVKQQNMTQILYFGPGGWQIGSHVKYVKVNNSQEAWALLRSLY